MKLMQHVVEYNDVVRLYWYDFEGGQTMIEERRWMKEGSGNLRSMSGAKSRSMKSGKTYGSAVAAFKKDKIILPDFSYIITTNTTRRSLKSRH